MICFVVGAIGGAASGLVLSIKLLAHQTGKWTSHFHADGSQEKTPVYVGTVNETFTYAIEDLKANWRAHRSRFLKEIEA